MFFCLLYFRDVSVLYYFIYLFIVFFALLK